MSCCQLAQQCTAVIRSNVVPMKEVACPICNHMWGIAAWTLTRLIYCFLEAMDSLFHPPGDRPVVTDDSLLSTLRSSSSQSRSTSPTSTLMPLNTLETQKSLKSQGRLLGPCQFMSHKDHPSAVLTIYTLSKLHLHDERRSISSAVPHHTVQPPSTIKFSPVTQADKSLAK